MKKTLSVLLSLIMAISVVSGTQTVALAASLGQVKGLAYSNLTTTSVKLKWKKVSNAGGYYVYKYYKSKNEYKKVATVKSTNYTVKKLKTGTTYRFTVKAYKKSGKKTTKGKMSSKLCLSTKPAKVKGLVSHIYDTKSITLTWSKVANASGYCIYKYNPSKKKYEKITEVKSAKAKISSLSSGKSYKFKVRAYRTVEMKRYYGDYSAVYTKSTIANTDVKQKLLNGYLYIGSPQSPQLEEIAFYSDGTFIQYLYDCGFSNGNLYAYISGTYNIVNGIVKMHETYYYDYDSGASWNTDSKWNFYYDSNKNYFRSTDYYYGDWCYVRYYYKTSPVSKADRVSYYQSHICNEIWI